MSGVGRIGGPDPIQPVRSRAAGGGSVFNMPAGKSAGGASATRAASEVGLGTLLALQDAPEPPEDREARRHGRDLLKELAALHRALLGDAGDYNGLEQLSGLVENAPADALDPRLRDVIADIRLRARVEIARYTTNR